MMQLGTSPATAYNNFRYPKQGTAKQPVTHFGVSPASYANMDSKISGDDDVSSSVQSAADSDQALQERRLADLRNQQQTAQNNANQAAAAQHLRFMALA
jgi:hypothetical protein